VEWTPAGWATTDLVAALRGRASPAAPAAAIDRFCQSWNEHCQPFSWTKPADQILAKLNRQTNSATEH